MIIYFSGTGNSLGIARQIASAIGDTVQALTEAVRQDLTSEDRIGLIYPSYDFNAPPAVRSLVPRLKLNTRAYVYIIIACGAQAGNSIWSIRRLLKARGIEVAYSNKIRVPDNSAIVFGRNPNDQVWKFSRFASRLQMIIADIRAGKHEHHYAQWGPTAAIMGTERMQQWMIRTFRPSVNEDKCIGCGICARICPMRNIAVDEKACIGPHCTACLACLHSCPQQAIEVGKKATNRQYQYRHPDVKAKDLMLNE
ncbi:MAG: EFR1 family ferrodoxin [Paludibacteraceae bacterium]|nr:EFR1 family ferrodoxin [Paludibacteraceae bacterium]